MTGETLPAVGRKGTVMRKIGYSTGIKAVVILLQELFSVVLVISIVLISTMLDKSMLNRKDLNNHTFTESKYYDKLFGEAVEEVLRYVKFQEQFETDGTYNPEKTVNILAFCKERAEGPGTWLPMSGNDMLYYYLVDLENWSREYVNQELLIHNQLYVGADQLLHQSQEVLIDGETVRQADITVETVGDMDPSLQEMIVRNAQYYYGGYYNLEEHLSKSATSSTVVFGEVQEQTDTEQAAVSDASADSAAQVPMEEIVQKVIDGRLFELKGTELSAILYDLGLLEVQTEEQRWVLEEKYRTVDGSTILEAFLNETISLQEMQRSYESLEYTLETIGPEISLYKRLVNKYEQGKSNLQFWIYADNQEQSYSNMPEGMDREDLLTYGKSLGSYFYYNKNDIRLDTNVGGMETMFYEGLESYNNGQNSVVFVGVDTSFPQEDSFYAAMEDYNLLKPWSIFSLAASIVCVFGSFLCFIYLSLAAGRNSEDSEIHLNWFDKIKTEILMAAFFVVGIGVIFLTRTLIQLFKGSDLISLMIMAGGLAVIVVAVFMLFYMSFIRRMKAGEMWTGSLLYWIGSGIYKVFCNRRPSVRILVLFAGHVLLTLLMAVVAMSWRNDRLVVLLVLVSYLFLSGGEALMFLRQGVQRNVIIHGIKRIAGGDLEFEIDTEVLKGDNKVMGEAINTIGEGLYRAVDDSMKNERLKADLITNVSHDIKTPLTSIINYVDLLKREDLDNERARGYIGVLDAKSQRLKQLTEDLVEASKISSGNITLQMDTLNFVELVNQTAGEFNEKFEARGLTAVTRLPREPVMILADGRRIWRVIENLYNNVAKYAMENTRVYVDMEVSASSVAFSIKNISEQPLNIEASELTERFIRGDVSRSTEGSGLGLSIAQDLTRLMNGTFDIYLDGDLFKVTVTFPIAGKTAASES